MNNNVLDLIDSLIYFDFIKMFALGNVMIIFSLSDNIERFQKPINKDRPLRNQFSINLPV